MTRIERFVAYAIAFRKAFETDDWSEVREFFTEDAEYFVPADPPLGGCFRGRDAVLAYFKDILDRVDRRFESHERSVIEGPREDGYSVWFRGRLVYRAAGVPDLVVEVEEEATFRGDCIRKLVDTYTPVMRERMSAYWNEFGPTLGIRTS